MNLSFCAIVKNEEKMLARCLYSVKDAVDEIIILDTGSTDKTIEIAQQFGAKIYHFNWGDDFAAARNESLKYAKCDWILVLDADEILAPDIIPQIRQVIQNQDLILVNLLRQEVGAKQSPYSLVSRLFRNHPDVYFSRPYHALVDDSIINLLEKEKWQIVSLSDIGILHDGYQKQAISGKNKWQKARQAMERFLESHPQDPYTSSKLGALYVESGELTKGIELLEIGLGAVKSTTTTGKESNQQVDDLVLYELYYHLGIAYKKQGNLTQAMKYYRAATKLNILPSLKLGAYLNLGNLLKEEGDLTGAKIVYEAAITADANFILGYYNLALTLKAMGNYVRSIDLYKRAIKLNPDYAEAYQNLGVSLFKIGKMSESLAAFQSAIKLHQQQQNFAEAERLKQGIKEMGLGTI
jgi:tetratricopeptide (TPR) repeat protein